MIPILKIIYVLQEIRPNICNLKIYVPSSERTHISPANKKMGLFYFKAKITKSQGLIYDDSLYFDIKYYLYERGLVQTQENIPF